jgi:hypothetical protein
MFCFDTAFLISVVIGKVLVYIDSPAWSWLSFTNKKVLDVEGSELVIPADDAGRFV